MAGETAAHLELKRLALEWSYACGYRVQAFEVSIPMLHARVDLAGARTTRGKRRGAVAFFECKQSIADFRNHSRVESLIKNRLVKLAERRQLYEEWLQVKAPHLRNGDALFPEYDTWDFASVDWEPYRKLLHEILRLTARLKENTKFDRMWRLGWANLHYVVATPESVKHSEIPPNWGLLIQNGKTLELARRPVWRDLTPGRREMIVERIGAAASRELRRWSGTA